MKLINAVKANLAANEMCGMIWQYDLALALIKVKRATADEVIFFTEREHGIAMEYAELTADGRLALSPEGRFKHKDPARGPEYFRRCRELEDTEVSHVPEAIRVKAPAEIRPSWIEALEGYIEFTDPGVAE